MIADGVVVTGIASAFPPARDQDELWHGYFGPRLGGDRWARRVYASTAVSRRHCAVDPLVEDVSEWSTGRRMARYGEEAVPLATAASLGALAEAGVVAADVGLLVVVSCTGYVTPGVDAQVARNLGMDTAVQRLLIGHMGCFAALPGLGAAADFAQARGRAALLVCVELCSLHAQPLSGDPQQVVTHALFGDAAAAAVVEPCAGPPACRALWEVTDLAARSELEAADQLTWDVTDLGFRMGLSRRVPDVLARSIEPLVDDLLDRNGLDPKEVAAWAVHPGGPRILDVATARLGLPDHALDASRRVLAERGNCSSATVLLILDELRRGPLPAGGPVVALAFGPGLTLYAALLRAGL